MSSNMGRIALLMPIVAAMAKRAGIPDGSRAGLAGAGGRVWHLPALGHYFARQRAQPGDERRGGRLIRHPPELCSVSAAAHPGAGYSQRPDSDWPDLLAVPGNPKPAKDLAPSEPMGRDEQLARLLAVVLTMWVTESWHGVGPAWTGLAASVVVMLPRIGFITGEEFSAG